MQSRPENRLILMALFFILPMIQCNQSAGITDSTEYDSAAGSRSLISSLFINNFDNYNSDVFQKANWTNNGMFDCGWLPDHVSFSDGNLIVRLDDQPSYGKNYSSGEYRTWDSFGYGTFECRMKSAKGVGTTSTFFTYTGPSDGTIWDELDVEIISFDEITQQRRDVIQFNYYTNGIGNHEYRYYPDFDPSAGFHVYKMKWLPGQIRWYVDDTLIYTATGSDIPVTPMRIMMNLWPGNRNMPDIVHWLGLFDPGNNDPALPLTAEYDWVKFTPATPEELAQVGKLQNGDFSEGTDYWTFLENVDGVSDSTGTFNVVNDMAQIDVANPGSVIYSLQLNQGGLKIEAGKQYTVSFDARADSARPIEVSIASMASGSWKSYQGDAFVADLTTDWQTFSYSFNMLDPTDTMARIEINTGLYNPDISIDNVTISDTEIPPHDLYNGNFSQGNYGWVYSTSVSAAWNTGNGYADIQIPNGVNTGTDRSNISLSQIAIRLEAGQQYRLGYSAEWAAGSRYFPGARSITVKLSGTVDDSTVNFINENEVLQWTWIRHSYYFTVNSTEDVSAVLQFLTGGDTDVGRDVHIDDITLEKVSGSNPVDGSLTDSSPSVDWHDGNYAIVGDASVVSGNNSEFTMEFPLTEATWISSVNYRNIGTAYNRISGITVFSVAPDDSETMVFQGDPGVTWNGRLSFDPVYAAKIRIRFSSTVNRGVFVVAGIQPAFKEYGAVPYDIGSWNKMVVDNAGDIWFTAPGSKRIVRMNRTTSQFTGYQVTYTPRGLTYDGSYGRIFVTESSYSNDHYGVLNINTGNLAEYPTGLSGSSAVDCLGFLDPNGNFWFSGWDSGIMAKGKSDGTITGIPLPGGYTSGLAIDAARNLWLTKVGWYESNPQLCKITQGGTVTAIDFPTSPRVLRSPIVTGDKVYFASGTFNNGYTGHYSIGCFDPATGTFGDFVIPTPHQGNIQFAVDQSGRIWFTESATDKIGLFDPQTGVIKEYPIPFAGAEPMSIAVDKARKTVWFTESGTNKIGSLQF